MPESNLYLGIDVGTSGVRTAVIDKNGAVHGSAATSMAAPIRIDDRPCQDANIWWQAATDCLSKQAEQLKAGGRHMRDIAAISVDGTSGTLLLADNDLTPVTHGYMYNSGDFIEEANTIAAVAPKNSITRGPGSGLARLLFLQKQTANGVAAHALHQADWIAAKLMNRAGFSDETNVLKMGFDVMQRQWPDWFATCGVRFDLLPQVKPVGDRLGVVGRQSASDFGFNNGTQIIAGTTDSNAAFLASGASKIGDGVTSLGTTLAIKLLSEAPVTDPSRGIYSHRIKDMWLPGGASNTGGGVLLDFFTAQQMQDMEQQLNPGNPTRLNFYPLSQPGERFPVSDSNFPPQLTPRPDSDVTFFQGLLEGIAEIEKVGYAALEELGAGKLRKVYTAGGGARNSAWTQIRATKLDVPIADAQSSDAAVGAARIAAGLI